MPLDIAILLSILAAVVVVLAFDWVPAEVAGLLVMLGLIITGLLSPTDAFAGFGSETVLMILGLLIMTAALTRTGAVDGFARFASAHAGTSPQRLLLMVTVPVTFLSSFISNTAATALFLPLTIGVAARAKLDASLFLMPVAFAAILASSVTLVGTSTNIVISGLLERYGMPPIGMFELTAAGLPIAVLGLAYLLLIGRRLIPRRREVRDLTEQFGIRQYLGELVVRPASPLVGKTLVDAGLGKNHDISVLQIVRSDGRRIKARSDTKWEQGDLLVVEAESDKLLKIQETAGIDIKGDVTVTDTDLQSDEVRLAEVIVLPGSRLAGRTLASARFRERHGLQVLAINRRGGTIRRTIGQVRLRMGDVLLVQGDAGSIAALDEEKAFHVLGEVEARRLNLRRAPLAAAIFAGAVAIATAKVLPLPVAVMAGAALVFLTRCVTPEEAYQEVDWKVLILIGSMLAVGTAMESTGTARFLAARLLEWVGTPQPVWLLAVFFVMTVLLTQPMSNQAAAVVVLPVAVATAAQLGWNPRPFAVMIAVAASTSFITPLEPACLMVYGPGRYRFFDFVRVGAPLTLAIFGLAIWLVPRLWPI
jgi:di/tricarboxylate transporter